MNRLRSAIAGVVDFIAGDDLPLAVGVVATIAVTYLISRHNTGAWWLPPVAVALLVSISVWRVVRRMR